MCALVQRQGHCLGLRTSPSTHVSDSSLLLHTQPRISATTVLWSPPQPWRRLSRVRTAGPGRFPCHLVTAAHTSQWQLYGAHQPLANFPQQSSTLRGRQLVHAPRAALPEANVRMCGGPIGGGGGGGSIVTTGLARALKVNIKRGAILIPIGWLNRCQSRRNGGGSRRALPSGKKCTFWRANRKHKCAERSWNEYERAVSSSHGRRFLSQLR